MCEKCEKAMRLRGSDFFNFIKTFRSIDEVEKEEKVKIDQKVEFAVWNEEESDKPKKVFFKLEQVRDVVLLIAVNENGERINGGNILAIKPEGIVHLCGSINKDIGLQLTSNGEVVTE